MLIRSTPLARPLLEELERQIARRGAYAIMRVNWSLWPIDDGWAAEAPEDLLGELPEIDRFACDRMDARITLDAPENTRAAADLPAERLALAHAAEKVFYRRSMTSEIPWVSCQYPTNALAQEAGLTLDQLDGDRLRRVPARLGRRGRADAPLRRPVRRGGRDPHRRRGHRPHDLARRPPRRGRRRAQEHAGGEFFFAPVESSANGVITFSEYPAVHNGQELEGIRLEFDGGKVVSASAMRGEDILHGILDRDEGARRIGELGIGCNPGITRYMKNVLFDEKIDGSIHLALGQSYTSIGGQNTSSVHWDIVKDLRSGGRIELDGQVVQQDGAWWI